MKAILSSLALTALLILPSCETIQSARDTLAEMPQAEYDELVIEVEVRAQSAAESLADAIGDDPQLIQDISELAKQLQTALDTDSIDAPDIINYLVERFGSELGLSEDYKGYIKDGAKVIDAAVGQIRLGIDGKLSEREKDLAHAFLNGVRAGLIQ